jgi:hypothetical protein
MLRTEDPQRFRDATLVRIPQPDHTRGAALPFAHETYEKGRDLSLSVRVLPSGVPFPNPRCVRSA